ncbi:MAG: tripartite tricarboxylate transporter TctB family protein [Elusimicrobiota bacterium]|jgi:hypothetical protein|nr:tripartite tricarboxylate transporter TctB family protein [Elusimicrobiota bacterium]
MTKSGIIFCLCCIAAALFFMLLALGFPGASADGTPGPGYFPIIVSSAVIALSLVLSISYIKRKEKYFQTNEIERANFPTLLLTGAAIVIYAVLFMFIPFVPLSIAFLIFLNRLYQRSWRFNIIFSILFTLCAYFIFEKFLHVML